VLIGRETAHFEHIRRPRPTDSKRRSSTHPQRSRKWRCAGDLSFAFGRSDGAFAYADTGLLGFLHESGALPELLWRDGCCEDSEELVLRTSFHLLFPFLRLERNTADDLDSFRRPQSTTPASHPYCQLPVPSQDPRTSISPTGSIQSLHMAPLRN
jgi:hypothetical protein